MPPGYITLIKNNCVGAAAAFPRLASFISHLISAGRDVWSTGLQAVTATIEGHFVSIYDTPVTSGAVIYWFVEEEEHRRDV